MAREVICGIYKITNNVNGKVYIGQAHDIYKRWHEHKHLGWNKSKTIILYKAIRKYGASNFKYEILEQCEEEHLDEREQYYIKYYDSFAFKDNPKGYNMTLGGSGSKGYVPEASTRKIWSEHRKGEKNGRALPVICEGKRFGTIKECAEYYHIEKTSMQGWLTKRTGMPYEFVIKQLHYESQPFDSIVTKHYHIVIFDGKFFRGFGELGRSIGIKGYTIARCIERNEFVEGLLNHSLTVDGNVIDTSTPQKAKRRNKKGGENECKKK